MLMWVTYVIGIFVAYPIIRWSMKRDIGRWTIGIRNLVILQSFLSWLGIVIVGLIHVGDLFDDERPLK